MFFNRPLEGTTEIVSAYYMVVVAYLPWAFVARHDNHIAADIIHPLISAAGGVLDRRFSVKVLTISYVSIFVYQTASQAIGSDENPGSLAGGIDLHPGMAEPLAAADRRRPDADLSRGAGDR